MENEIQTLRDSLKKATNETKQMKNINKDLLDQLNLKQRSGSPQTKVTELSEHHPAEPGSIKENDSILDEASNHDHNAYGDNTDGISTRQKMANTAKASFFRNKSS